MSHEITVAGREAQVGGTTAARYDCYIIVEDYKRPGGDLLLHETFADERRAWERYEELRDEFLDPEGRWHDGLNLRLYVEGEPVAGEGR